MEENKLIYDVEDKVPFRKLIVFAIQQVLAVLAATIAVPTIIGLPTQIPAAILGGGVGTIIYLLFTKFKSPVVISSSFAFLGALGTAVAFGYCGIILGGILAGLVYVIIAIIIKFTGTNWTRKLFPLPVIGPTVAIIGLGLAGSAMGDIVKANGYFNGNVYNLVGLLCGLITFFTVVICSVQKKFKTAKLLPFIIGIGVGYAVASIFTIIGNIAEVDYLKVIDWSPLVNNFKDFSFSSIIDYPRFALIEAIKELKNGNVSEAILAATEGNGSVITWAGVAEVALAFVPVAFVTFAEHIADHVNLGTIVGRHLLNGEPGMSRTLLGDGVGSMVGTVFGICPNTTYGESVGCVAITKNASVRTIFVAAIMLIVLSFLSPITSLLRTIPSAVMGGVCLTLYGFIAVSGFKMFQPIDLNNNRNLFTVSAVLIAGIGGLTIQIPYEVVGGVATKTIEIAKVATALILGISTYYIAGKVGGKDLSSEADNGIAPEAAEDFKNRMTGKH